MLAKKYGVMVEMYFPTTEAISQPTPIPMPAFNTADCYASLRRPKVGTKDKPPHRGSEGKGRDRT